MKPQTPKPLTLASPAPQVCAAGAAAPTQNGRCMRTCRPSFHARTPPPRAAGLSPVHGLFAAAGEDGSLECFDLRAKAAVGHLDAAAKCGAAGGVHPP
jgi:hypothetical protein